MSSPPAKKQCKATRPRPMSDAPATSKKRPAHSIYVVDNEAARQALHKPPFQSRIKEANPEASEMLPVIRDFSEALARSNCPNPEKTIKEDPILAAKICPEFESIMRRYDAQKRDWQKLTQTPPAVGPATKMIIDSLLGNCKAAMDETGHWIDQIQRHRPSDHASSDLNHAGSDHDKAPSS